MEIFICVLHFILTLASGALLFVSFYAFLNLTKKGFKPAQACLASVLAMAVSLVIKEALTDNLSVNPLSILVSGNWIKLDSVALISEHWTGNPISFLFLFTARSALLQLGPAVALLIVAGLVIETIENAKLRKKQMPVST